MGTISTSTSLDTTVERYMAGLRMPSNAYAQVYDISNDDTPAKRISGDTGVGAIPVWTNGVGDRTERSVDTSFALSMDYVVYGLTVNLPKFRAMDSPQLLGDTAQRLGRETAASRKKLAELAVVAAYTTNMDAFSVPLISDSHTTTGAVRDNKSTTALDRTALMAAITQARSWVTYERTEYDLADFGWYLVIGTTLEDTARQLMANQSGGSSGNDTQSVIASDLNITVVVNHQMDTNDWMLISKAETPFKWWERAAPEFDAWIDRDSGAPRISVDYADAFGRGPLPDGVFGALVA